MFSQTHKIIGVILLLCVLALAVTGISLVYPSASNQGYAPEQPIPFSHRLHAGQNKIACVYCHSDVGRSRHASIPAVKTCMNCHMVVRTDSPHIQKLMKAYSDGVPIEWVRVHELADYVYFSHKRHVKIGLQCETCHGDVKEMDRIEQKSALTMGWCMECHRGKTTPHEVMAKIYPQLSNGTASAHGHAAPTECSTCHN